MKKYNFYAGPAILPQEVFETASEAVKSYKETGLSILELSHRSKELVEVLENAQSLAKELLGLSDEYHVLFLQGGASSQFYMSAMNFLGEGEKAGYIDTGAWSKKAIKEAKQIGDIDVLASSSDQNYGYIPKGYQIDDSLKYLHLTTNNTIFGTQFHEWPETNVPFIADMSSEIFSRKLDMSKFGMIYAGAQKNLGPAGTTLVIIDPEFAKKNNDNLLSMIDYQTHIDKGSAFNTWPVFAVYVSMLTMEWIKKSGGVAVMEQKNKDKAQLLYDEIERNPMFVGTAAKEDRSMMNVCFLLNDDSKNDSFLEMATSAGCIGVKGHRSVGGFRASIYNAMPKEGIETLVDVMQSFEKQYG